MSLNQIWVKKCETQGKSGRSRGPARQRGSQNAGSGKGGADGAGTFSTPSSSSFAVFKLPQEALAADELQASYGMAQKHETEGTDSINSPAASTSLQISKDKTPSEQGKAKSVSVKRKKKKELLSKANASTSLQISKDKTPSEQGKAKIVSVKRKKKRELLSKANASTSLQISKDTTPSEQGKEKIVSVKRKKKRELLSKANAAGTTSGLYVAYKTPELNQESATVEIAVTSPGIDGKLMSSCDVDKEISVKEEDTRGKSEPNDWEAAAEISSPNLKASEKSEEKYHIKNHEKHDSESIGRKRYTRDFLITFSEHYKDLTPGFEIGADIADILGIPVNVSSVVNSETFHSGGGRVFDRQPIGPRLERRGSSLLEEDKRGKVAIPFVSAQMGLAHGVATGGRTNQGGKLGALKNPRGQPIGRSVTGVLSGPMHSLAFPSGLSMLSAEADRWQHANSVQKDLIPSPHTAMVVMHKAEKSNEVGKASDKEEAKQRKVQAILNKLKTQNFEMLFMEVKEADIYSVVTLRGVISQIFDEALMEPTFCEMYANLCCHLARALPDMVENNKKITFKRLLLNKCQEEIERGEREQAEADKNEEDGVAKQTEEDREEQRFKSHRRLLGNIRLMGELYKKKMLKERVMHECINKLLGQFDDPDEEDLEALCKLMSTIGAVIDHPMAKEHMDAYFDRMQKLSTSEKVSSGVRSMLKDIIDLRKNKRRWWRKVGRPKKMEEVHRDAAQ